MKYLLFCFIALSCTSDAGNDYKKGDSHGVYFCSRHGVEYVAFNGYSASVSYDTDGKVVKCVR
jgi:hypothetical protein